MARKKASKSCASAGSRKIYTGARGGKYYMCKGKKVYLSAGAGGAPAARRRGGRSSAEVEAENAAFEADRAARQAVFEEQLRAGASVPEARAEAVAAVPMAPAAPAFRMSGGGKLRVSKRASAAAAGSLIPNAPSAPGGRIRGGGGRISKKELEDLASRKYRAAQLAENKRLMQEFKDDRAAIWRKRDKRLAAEDAAAARAPKTDYMGYSIDDQPDFAPQIMPPPRSGPRQDYMGYDIDDSPRTGGGGWFSGWFS
jgi:hypothetical protein